MKKTNVCECLKALTGGENEWGYRSSPGFEGTMEFGLVERRLPWTGADLREVWTPLLSVRRSEEPGLQAAVLGDAGGSFVAKDHPGERREVGLMELVKEESQP